MLPAYPPVSLPRRPRRDWLGTVLAVLLVFSAVLTVGGGATAVAATRGDASGGATFVGQLRVDVLAPALRALLDRRAKAVHDHDARAFLADIDDTDGTFVRKEREEFDNLGRLSLAEFRYDSEMGGRYDAMIPANIRSRYHSVARAPAVTVLYRVDGMDSEPLAAPWAPIFGFLHGRWWLAGVVDDPRLPTGAGGQAWETGPITVVRSDRVVLVLSAGDAGRAPDLLRMAETGLRHVAEVRRGGWAGRVLITAVQDARLFTTYFAESTDRINNVAAIAVPYYASVPDWTKARKYVATRVVFNPHEFTADPTELAHDLTHEFTHAAMGPETTEWTPTWLVEGFAEYVAYKPEAVSNLFAKRVLATSATALTPPGDGFYDDARNYVLAWLACRMIAQKYGEAKLMALYEAYRSAPMATDAMEAVLGLDDTGFNLQYASYVAKVRTGSLP